MWHELVESSRYLDIERTKRCKIFLVAAVEGVLKIICLVDTGTILRAMSHDWWRSGVVDTRLENICEAAKICEMRTQFLPKRH